jgi:hypothetical protein
MFSGVREQSFSADFLKRVPFSFKPNFRGKIKRNKKSIKSLKIYTAESFRIQAESVDFPRIRSEKKRNSCQEIDRIPPEFGEE